MLKRSYFNVFTASTLLLGAAFGCGCAPETPEISPEIAASHSVDYSAAPDGEVAHLKTETGYDAFIKSAPVAVVKFGAQWCPPCRAFEPDLRKQAGYFDGRGVLFAEVDVDELGEKARELGVQSIPDVRVYLDGREYAQIVGYQPHSLANLVESLCEPAPSQPKEPAPSNASPTKAAQPTPITVDQLSALETSADAASSPESAPAAQKEEKTLEEELWPTE